jgi:transducin (beta)-like 1
MIPDGPSGVAAQAAATRTLVLKHFKGKTNEKSKDVTTLDWNVSIHICRTIVSSIPCP